MKRAHDNMTTLRAWCEARLCEPRGDTHEHSAIVLETLDALADDLEDAKESLKKTRRDVDAVTYALGVTASSGDIEGVTTTTDEGGALATALIVRLEAAEATEDELATLRVLAEHTYALINDLDARRPSPYPLYPIREALHMLGKSVDRRVD